MTALFCDLVDSVGLSIRLDPEDLMRVYDLYRQCCEDVVARHDGYLAQYMGDGILAYFGYPRADEDGAAKAVRAGLELAAKVATLEAGLDPPLKARVGVASGLVVVSNPVGPGGGGTPGIVGKMPNLAARLQSLAPPGGVVISEETRALTRGLFHYRDLGPVTLKGFDQPVRAWEAITASGVGSRFEARKLGTEGPFVGRDTEVAVLLGAFDSAAAGAGRVVLVRGEAGIGKSRLIQALESAISAYPPARLRWFCSPQHVESPFHPVIDQLERRAGIARTDTAAVRLEKLVGQFGDADEARLAVLADLLAAPLGRPTLLAEVSPEKRREITCDQMLDMVARFAGERPQLILVEDAHWIDASTLDLLDRLIEATAGRRALVVVTARPEFRPRWDQMPFVETINLAPLDTASASQLCGHLAGDALSDEVLRQILARGEGNPLFVEELTRTVVESLNGLEGGAGDAAVAIPQTLHDSLIARLDRLGPVRQVANIGAVIGRRFDYGLLAEIAAKPEDDLQADLQRLISSGLVQGFGAPPTSSYVFRHALIRDAAYDSLLRSDRQALHSQLAEVLRTRFPDLTAAEPETMAYHLDKSGAADRAIPYLEAAGRKAASRAAHLEASGYYRAALEALRRQPDDDARARRELSIELPLARSVVSTQNYASEAFHDVLTRARGLCDRLGDDAELFPVLRGLFSFALVRGDTRSAEELADRCLQIGQRSERPAHLIEARNVLGYLQFCRGEFRSARTHLQLALRLCEENPDARLEAMAETDQRVTAGSLLALTLCYLGEQDEGHEVGRQTLDWARSLQNPYDIAYALVYAANVGLNLGRLADARVLGEEAIAICKAHGFATWLLPAQSCVACVKGLMGHTLEAIAELEPVIEVWRRVDQHLQAAAGIGMLASLYAVAGRRDEARATIERAIAEALAYEDRSYLSGLYMTRASILRTSEPPDLEAARADLRQAVVVARNQGAKVLEAAAARTLRRLEVQAPA